MATSPPTGSFTWSMRSAARFVVLHLVMLTVGLMGAGALVNGIRLLLAGEQRASAIAAVVMGLICTVAAIAFLYFEHVKGPAKAAREATIRERYPDQPWMLRADWAARRVTDSSASAAIFLWIWNAGWWGAMLFIWTMNRDKILAAVAKSWSEAAFAAIFLLCGLIGLLVAVTITRNWWRYGRSELRIDTLPGYLGERFRGSVAVNFAQRPTEGLEATLTCERITWITRRDSKGRTTSERVGEELWSADHKIEPTRILLAPRARASVPIDLPVPANQPPCDIDEAGNGIQWQLSLRTLGPPSPQGFSCSFQIPIYARTRR